MTRARIPAVAAALLAAACGGGAPSAPSPTSPPVVLTAASFDSVVLASQLPCLVEFYHPSCSHCQAMASTVNRLASDFAGRALVGTVNVQEQGALTQSYGVTAVPTFVFFQHGREVPPRQLGTTSYQALAGRLNALITAR
jgi:thioredoxin 1